MNRAALLDRLADRIREVARRHFFECDPSRAATVIVDNADLLSPGIGA